MVETYDPKFKELSRKCIYGRSLHYTASQQEYWCRGHFELVVNDAAGDILNWLTGLRSAETRTRVMFQSGIIVNCK
jgi:hypothetical protein